MQGSLLFLGTGGSMGVPVIGCTCPVCTSSDSHNRRLRPSALIKVKDKQFLIDPNPDFREQALRTKLSHLNGVLITHHHADHVGGIDDLRVFYFIQQKRIPCYLSDEALEDIKLRFHYIFRPLDEKASISAQLDFHVLKDPAGSFSCEGIDFRYFTYFQPKTKVTGYRVGNLAYVSDIRTYDESIFKELEGVETLVISALRWTPSVMHFSVEEAIAFSRKVGAERTYFTHIAHELDHQETNAQLPPDIRLSYDGLEIPFQLADDI